MPVKKSDVRVYGNQHGSWIELSGELLARFQTMSRLTGKTVEELLMTAIDEKVQRVLGDGR